MNWMSKALAIACGMGAATAALAQADWPARPVTVVVPSSAGGGTDAYGRILAATLTEQLKQNFVVDNKPGASGAIGATAVAKAEPDGYTLLVASNSSLGINPVLYKTLTYDVIRDFAPVSRGVIAPMVIVAHPDAKVKTLAELLERGKKEPAKLFYGTAGVGSPLYIGVRMIEVASGAQFSHVPYKGVAPAYTDLLGGRLQFMLTDLASVRPYIDAGKLVALGRDRQDEAAAGHAYAGRGRAGGHQGLHLVLGAAARTHAAGAGQARGRRGGQGDAQSRRGAEARSAGAAAGVRHAGAVQRVAQGGAAELGRVHPREQHHPRLTGHVPQRKSPARHGRRGF